MRRFTKKTIAVAAITVVLLSGATVAFAYWSAGGSGTGSATTGSSSTPIAAVQTSVVSGLGPGVAAQTLSGNFTNGNSGAVYVTSVSASISSVTKAAGAPAGSCTAADFTLSNATMNVGAEVPAGTAQGSWTGATLAFNDNPSSNQDGCKGATVSLAYTVS